MFRYHRLARAAILAIGGGAAVSLSWSQQAVEQLERVEVTGSSIKRIDAETSLPIQIITREQIQKTGATNVEQLLQSISSVSSSGGLTSASASGATTGGISAVSLHGLTSLRTLVLLNGRRIAPYGVGFTGDSVSVDVNSIPLAAIERVEVLKDGTSRMLPLRQKYLQHRRRNSREIDAMHVLVVLEARPSLRVLCTGEIPCHAG